MLNLNTYMQSVLNRGYRSSAISPLLWLNALVTIPSLVVSTIIQTWFRWAPFSLGAFLLGYTLWMYRHLVRINPRLVQSEKFQLEMQKLDLVAEKGGPILIDPVELPLSDDPKMLAEPKFVVSEEGESK